MVSPYTKGIWAAVGIVVAVAMDEGGDVRASVVVLADSLFRVTDILLIDC